MKRLLVLMTFCFLSMLSNVCAREGLKVSARILTGDEFCKQTLSREMAEQFSVGKFHEVTDIRGVTRIEYSHNQNELPDQSLAARELYSLSEKAGLLKLRARNTSGRTMHVSPEAIMHEVQGNPVPLDNEQVLKMYEKLRLSTGGTLAGAIIMASFAAIMVGGMEFVSYLEEDTAYSRMRFNHRGQLLSYSHRREWLPLAARLVFHAFFLGLFGGISAMCFHMYGKLKKVKKKFDLFKETVGARIINRTNRVVDTFQTDMPAVLMLQPGEALEIVQFVEYDPIPNQAQDATPTVRVVA